MLHEHSNTNTSWIISNWSSKKSKLLMRNVFSKRRKQLISIAKSAGEDSATLLRWLDESPEISPTARPETVPPNVWRNLDSIVSEGI